MKETLIEKINNRIGEQIEQLIMVQGTNAEGYYEGIVEGLKEAKKIIEEESKEKD